MVVFTGGHSFVLDVSVESIQYYKFVIKNTPLVLYVFVSCLHTLHVAKKNKINSDFY